jgi:hypothetical protein
VKTDTAYEPSRLEDAFFDAYTATSDKASWHGVQKALSKVVADFWETADKPGHFHFGFRRSYRMRGGDEIFALSWGGSHGERVMFEVKGRQASALVDAYRRFLPEHRCTRVDSAVDFLGPDSFDQAVDWCHRIAQEFGVWHERVGDWGQPELGRTVYLGSRQSLVRLRAYEKGKEPGLRGWAPPDWVRIEIQVRPERERKELYASLSPVQVWGAARWSREMWRLMMGSKLESVPVRKHYRSSNDDRAFSHACKQYGRLFRRIMEERGGWQGVAEAVANELEPLGERE